MTGYRSYKKGARVEEDTIVSIYKNKYKMKSAQVNNINYAYHLGNGNNVETRQERKKAKLKELTADLNVLDRRSGDTVTAVFTSYRTYSQLERAIETFL